MEPWRVSDGLGALVCSLHGADLYVLQPSRHIVPLAWAWARGADECTDRRRRAFALDTRNLQPVDAGMNRSKGADERLEWLPLNVSSRRYRGRSS